MYINFGMYLFTKNKLYSNSNLDKFKAFSKLAFKVKVIKAKNKRNISWHLKAKDLY